MSQTANSTKNLLPEEKRALLERLLRQRLDQPTLSPVSFGQRRLWFMDQLEPGSSAYSVPAALRLKGMLNIRALEAALDTVVRRHEILRTTFANVDGQPMQVVHPAASPRLTVQDLRTLPAELREPRALEVIREEALRPFNLAQGPLLRACIIRLANDEHVFMLNMHHIVTDGWSMAILVGELVTSYEAAIDSRPAPLQELPLQYADYAIWQRSWLEGEALVHELRYWREHLRGPLPKSELPNDYARPITQDYRGASCTTVLDRRLTESLLALSRREGVTLFMTLLTAFNALLYRYTGQEDIVLGTAISGRSQAEIEKLIGFFVNTLILRTDLSGQPDFIELLRRVREVSLGAYANQSVPFEKLVEELQPDRNLGKNPLFEIMFNFGNMPVKTVAIKGLSLSLIEIADPQAKHALTLYADETGDEIFLSVVYQRAIFAANRMESLLSQYAYLLRQIVEAPNKSLEAYSLCASETLHLLPDPRAPLSPLPYEPVTETFKRWVDRTPDQIAVSQLGREWTYRELDDCALKISRHLIAGGLQPGDTVAVLGPRSFALIAAVIAILQTRGILLLIDRTFPPHRRTQLLTEGRARQILIACEAGAESDSCGEFATIPVTRLRSWDGRFLDDVAPTAPVPLFHPKQEDPAYICFTSGSSGTPKGILSTQHGLAHFISWERAAVNITPDARVAQLSRLSFDIAMRDLFLPLTGGATLCLPPDQTEFDTDQILPWLESESISIVHIVPAVAWASLAKQTDEVTLKNLRWTLFAGEPLTASLVSRWRTAFPLAGEIANLYGPSETTLAKFYYHVPRDVSPGVQPVGLPLPQTQGLVINRHGQLCGVGEPGEIVIRTPYRSLGYLNPASEIGGKFVPNPYRDDDSDILYYTGDQGRYRADGLLEILGRIDHQVKIRGVRIEPEEIQSVISRHPGVSECVVVVREDTPNDQRLVAYVSLKPDVAPTISNLRSLIKRELPKYYHPSHFVILEKLPLLPNGKVDRHSLPEPDGARPDTKDPYIPPRDAVELKLSQIWEDTLKIKPIGMKDDFFEMGGHSLLAVHLMAQVEKAFKTVLPLSALFEEATIEKMALRLRQQRVVSAGPLVPIRTSGNRAPLFFVHPAGGNVLCYFDLAKRFEADQPFYGLQAYGFAEGTEPLPCIEDMATRYLDAVREVQADGPYLIGGWSMGAIVAYEMAQQLLKHGQNVVLLAMLDHRPPDPGSREERLDEVSLIQRFLADFIHLDARLLEGLSTDQRLEYFLQQAKSLSLVPEDIGIAQVKSYLKVYQANIEALHSYSATPYPGRITLLKTASEPPEADDTLGWGKLAGQGVEVFEVPGKHYDMVAEPHVEVVAQCLMSCLAKIQPVEPISP